MERMGGADALMLYLDRAEAYNHTIKLQIIDPAADPDGWSWKRFKAAWATRVGCPAPGTMVELCELICELYAHPLDHSRPLWQVWVIEGLAGGRVALLLLIHHALTDGIGILRMLNNFWRTRPESAEHPEPAPWHPARLPSKWRLLGDGLRDLPRVVSANLPGAWRGSRAGRRIVAEWRREGRDLPPSAGDSRYPAPFAKRLSPHRTFAARSFDLARFRTLGKSLGVTINDVFLATLAGAIRGLLREQERTAPDLPMVATVPFALVPLEERTRDGNYSTTCHALLHVEIGDPRERLQACKRSADTMKAWFEATREANLTAVLNLLPPLVPKLVDRINEMKGGGLLPFWNVVVSNVPGPRTPLQLGQLKLVEWYSIGQLAHGAALNVTVWSYVDQFNLCILSDPAVLDDAWRLIDTFEASLVELEAAARGT